MYDHQENWPMLQAEVLRRNYAKLMEQYEQALLAQSEGVFEVAVRSQTVALSITLDGFDIAQEVIEAISRKLTRAEDHIRKHAIDMGENMAWEQRKEEMREEQHKADIKRAQQEYAAQSQQLAQQAAAPAAKQPVGRPRKSTAVPCLVTSERVAYSALSVPMNSGSTAHAVVRATNLPQG